MQISDAVPDECRRTRKEVARRRVRGGRRKVREVGVLEGRLAAVMEARREHRENPYNVG